MNQFSNEMTALVEKIRSAAGERHSGLRERGRDLQSRLAHEHRERCATAERRRAARRSEIAAMKAAVGRRSAAAAAARHAVGADLRQAGAIWRKGHPF